MPIDEMEEINSKLYDHEVVNIVKIDANIYLGTDKSGVQVFSLPSYDQIDHLSEANGLNSNFIVDIQIDKNKKDL